MGNNCCSCAEGAEKEGSEDNIEDNIKSKFTS